MSTGPSSSGSETSGIGAEEFPLSIQALYEGRYNDRRIDVVT